MQVTPNTFNPVFTSGELETLATDMRQQFQLEKDEAPKEALERLQTMWNKLQKLDPEHTQTQLWGMVLGRYGVRLYPDFQKALPCLQAGIHLQLQGAQLQPKEAFTLDKELQEFELPPHFSPSLYEWLQTVTESIHNPRLQSLSSDQKFILAQNLLTLGYIYSNLSKNIKEQANITEKEFLPLTTHFYRGIENIFCSLPRTPEIQKELGELYYNIFPGLFLEECKLKKADNKAEPTFEEVEESFKIRQKAAEYNPHKSMEARINNLFACHVVDFKDKMELAKEASATSTRLWKEVLADPNLTAAEASTYQKLFLNAKSVYVYILKELGASMDEFKTQADDYLAFYQMNGDRDPYSMLHLMGLCRIKLHEKQKDEVLSWIQVIRQIADKYPKWNDTAMILQRAKEIEADAQKL